MKTILIGIAKAAVFIKTLEVKKASSKNKKGSYDKKFFRGNVK